MFVDSAKIHIKAGDGGNGKVSFRREKYVPAGGPDGGDGGKGGDVVFVGDDGMHTLSDFRYKTKYRAKNGSNGEGWNRSGKSGEDLYVRVPLGTMVFDAETGEIICDIVCNKQTGIIARGGKGGAGNQHFATPTKQAPDFAKAGNEGEERWVNVELKLLADVGLIGFPNVGKSTLLSVASSARPKIADYHFTTLTPNLGVVDIGDDASFVMADIPGLIEGAHNGLGIGEEFLRHIERTSLLLHIVDVAGTEGRDPLADFEIINNELKEYKVNLLGRPQIVVANKTDALSGDNGKLVDFRTEIEKRGYKVMDISAVTGYGVRELMNETYEMLQRALKNDNSVRAGEPESGNDYVEYRLQENITPRFIARIDDGVYVVEGKWLKKLLADVNFDNVESMQYFQRQLIRFGVIRELEGLGINEGDTVRIYDLEFDYVI